MVFWTRPIKYTKSFNKLSYSQCEHNMDSFISHFIQKWMQINWFFCVLHYSKPGHNESSFLRGESSHHLHHHHHLHNSNSAGGVLSNAVKNMINASILVVDSDLKETSFESKSCQDYASLQKPQPKRASTANNSSFSVAMTTKSGAKTRKSSMKRRARSQSLFAAASLANSSKNEESSDSSEFLKIAPASDLHISPGSTDSSDNNTKLNDLVSTSSSTLVNRRSSCKSATTNRTFYRESSAVKIPLFEHILLNSNASPINSATSTNSNASSSTSSAGLLLLSKASSSSRSNSSTFSNSSESFSETSKDHLIGETCSYIDVYSFMSQFLCEYTNIRWLYAVKTS